ncbi:radical SAM/SPASM domain-containing protein [Sulfurospirillum arcachonense]|uniref:radical SAM/SPASM domain-containing protein n=1 Tax=Sulfurospirillum arcachonense TaxID=57666 RepID=UPI0004693380|nr:SPASM domain-containing protein [Sulfurospirillum arcachonense]
MKFYRAYVEITNICGLECNFCPTKINPTHTMKLDFFEKVLYQLSPYTKEIALHVMGDPLILTNINMYLDLAYKHGFKVMITTSGYYLNQHSNIFHPSLKQINISLNSFNKNSTKKTFEEYMSGIFSLCQNRVNEDIFINLRLWNLDDKGSENSYNKQIFDRLEKYFKIKFPKDLLINPPKSFRLDKKILLHFDSYFEWPSLQSSHFSHNFCHGLSSQIAILADGRIVPCCLDGDGIIELGNLHTNSLEDILETQRVKKIQKNFKNNIAYEELCQKCTFKDRFNENL